MKKLKVGDVVRVVKYDKRQSKMVNRVGRITSIDSFVSWRISVQLFPITRVRYDCFDENELEKISDKEALAWLI